MKICCITACLSYYLVYYLICCSCAYWGISTCTINNVEQPENALLYEKKQVLSKFQRRFNSNCLKCCKCHVQILKILLWYCDVAMQGLSLLQKLRFTAMESLNLDSLKALILFAACQTFFMEWTSSSSFY